MVLTRLEAEGHSSKDTGLIAELDTLHTDVDKQGLRQ